MSKIDIHIVSFDVPYPPNYGGVIDVYYKIKALYDKGFKVALHCFDYGRGEQDKLKEVCSEVHYYKRDRFPWYLLSTKPYVVVSRRNQDLLNRLSEDDAPVLFEGLHTCYHLEQIKSLGKKVYVRMHNIEHDYYEGLAKVEKNLMKKRYFLREACKLKRYESVLKKADRVLAISPSDEAYLCKQYGNAELLPVFHASQKLESQIGRGNFAFYHGNLAVGENNEAALFLVNKVFAHTTLKLVIAGSGPSQELKKACESLTNVELKENLGTDSIDKLVSTAHANVLPTFQATGIKLKLILSLYKGRFCIANDAMVEETGLESLCIRANSPEEWQQNLMACFKKEFEEEDRRKREELLKQQFCTRTNAEILMQVLKEPIT